MTLEIKHGKEVPISYLAFLNNNPDGCYIDFKVDSEYESNTRIFGEAEQIENIEMDSIGNALQFESLKLYVSFQQKFGYSDSDAPRLTEKQLKQIENGFVFGYGENYGGYGYLYFDAAENHSIWVYDTNDGQVIKIADSFEDFIRNTKIIE